MRGKAGIGLGRGDTKCVTGDESFFEVLCYSIKAQNMVFALFFFLLIVEIPIEGLSLPPPAHLKQLLQAAQENHSALAMPCVYDGISARLVANQFPITFLSGFSVAAARGYPDRGILSLQELTESARQVTEALARATSSGPPIPLIADGDTGFDGSSAMSLRRTIFSYGAANCAAVMIEDQVFPKRCGHVAGKDVINFESAVKRVKIACAARDEYESKFGAGTGPLILARTDSNAIHGLEDAISRCKAFVTAGADITFLEAPKSLQELQQFCDSVPGPKLANMLEGGATPILSREQLGKIGVTLVAYPLSILGASILGASKILDVIKADGDISSPAMDFNKMKNTVGFQEMDEYENKFN